VSELIDELLADAGERMQKSVDATRTEFSTVRTGRASPHLLDRIQVDYYGTRTPLNQIAQISVPDARMLVITPYDKSAIKEIEKAVMESDLGLNPANDGAVVRLPIPQLTEDRRKDLVKVARHIAEEGRIAVRNVRRDCLQHLKELDRSGEAQADEVHRAEDRVQKLTDEHVKRIDEVLKGKEAEILEV
jgi:ribosome recycling factor